MASQHEVYEGTCRCGLGNRGSDCGGNCCCVKATWIEMFERMTCRCIHIYIYI